ncbi:MAG: capsule biosynthesis protein CapA [Litoreibacter sp.]|nr:capsule biosynthesis protein CapA [Litoreibacter sp.]
MPEANQMLRAAGCKTWRVGFNKGDEVFWSRPETYIAFSDVHDRWSETFENLVSEKHITDLVLYGDTRPIHAQAIEIARKAGLGIHVFEEGYLRPYWVSYERGGSNGNSRLMGMSVAQMRADLDGADHGQTEAPASWGDMRQHIFYGALYHFFVMLWNRNYHAFRPHRALPVAKEFQLYIKRLLTLPLTTLERRIATIRIMRGGFPYHLCLLQLEHDASFQAHSSFASMTDFLEVVIDGFAKGAPSHHHLVLKAHPLEDGRVPLRKQIKALARANSISNRVHYVRGGKLARLLNSARSAVTVNSTAAQQALWRGLPLKAFGAAVYDKPEFVSPQPLGDFFANPIRPDCRAYRDYRQYLLETSQVPGGFYSAKGRRQLLRQVVDMMLSAEDPYDALTSSTATPRQQLTLVRTR